MDRKNRLTFAGSRLGSFDSTVGSVEIDTMEPNVSPAPKLHSIVVLPATKSPK
jgi:hypothetical protein